MNSSPYWIYDKNLMYGRNQSQVQKTVYLNIMTL